MNTDVLHTVEHPPISEVVAAACSKHPNIIGQRDCAFCDRPLCVNCLASSDFCDQGCLRSYAAQQWGIQFPTLSLLLLSFLVFLVVSIGINGHTPLTILCMMLALAFWASSGLITWVSLKARQKVVLTENGNRTLKRLGWAFLQIGLFLNDRQSEWVRAFWLLIGIINLLGLSIVAMHYVKKTIIDKYLL